MTKTSPIKTDTADIFATKEQVESIKRHFNCDTLTAIKIARSILRGIKEAKELLNKDNK